jgi:diguanylate cyclase (GGDEF)-like protein/PAS domain S-box-containing protein
MTVSATAAHDCPLSLVPALPVPSARERTQRTADGIFLVLDADARVRYCSPGAYELFGRNAADLIGGAITSLIPDLPLRAGTAGYNLAYVGFHAGRGWRRSVALDGAGRELALDLTVDKMELGAAQGIVLTARRASTECPREVDLGPLITQLHGAADAVVITDVQGAVEYVNPAFEETTGFSSVEAAEQMPPIATSRAPTCSHCREIWPGPHDRLKLPGPLVCWEKKNGESFHAEESIRPFVDRFGRVTHYVVTLRDVGAWVEACDRLSHLANHDPLTGVPNRSLFLDRLRQELARATRAQAGFALLSVDVDQFKSINDRYGHVGGDEVLQAVAFRLKQCLRDVDTVARLGGDEFAVILVGLAGREHLQGVLDKISRALTDKFIVDERHVDVSVSVGTAVFPRDGQDERSLLVAADKAMYRAKRESGGRHRFAMSKAT